MGDFRVALGAGYCNCSCGIDGRIFRFQPEQASNGPRDNKRKISTTTPFKKPPTNSRQVDTGSAAVIAAILVEESRRAYYATGHPCACPDDVMRNGRRCGGNSAYSRP